MFPMRCIQLPWRNMLVNKVVTAGRLATSGGMAACPNTTAGMAPNRYTNNSAGSDGSETW